MKCSLGATKGMQRISIVELKKQLESAELKNQRLKEVFRTKITEFRQVCYKLTGYQIDMTCENQYRLTSVYAERQEDCLIFKMLGTLRYPPHHRWVSRGQMLGPLPYFIVYSGITVPIREHL
uniref:Uncharacterized protein n=1 Tax=Sphaerodactylus townsendi TaxID=933632 RepID=A0ACB8FKB0_9SAUR